MGSLAAVLRAGDPGQEQPHHLVPDQFVDERIMSDKDPGGYGVEPVEPPGKLGSRGFFAHAGGVADIGEQHAEVDFDSSWWQVVEAVLAHVRVLAGRLAADHAEQLAASTSERVLAQLAAGITRKVTEYPLGPL